MRVLFSPRTRHQKSVWWYLFVFLWLVTLTTTAQIRAGGFHAEMYHPDEPAHFVTGVMVAEYLRGAEFTAPVEFAEAFYLRYPKVAFGHWPPLFYFVQAAWYLPFGISKLSALTLVAFLTTITAGSIYLWLERKTSKQTALITVTLFLIMPLPSIYSTRVSSEMLVELFFALGLFASIATLERRSWLYFAAYLACVTLGLMTKETIIPLILCLPVAVVFSGRLALLGNVWVWLATGLAALCLLGFAQAKLTSEFGWHGMHSFPQLANWIFRHGDLANSVSRHLELAHPLVLAIAFLGALHGIVANGSTKTTAHQPATNHRTLTSVASAALLASVAFAALVGKIEIRYLMPALLPLLMLFALGLEAVPRLLPAKLSVASRPTAICVGFFAIGLSLEPMPIRPRGFANVAAAIKHDEAPRVILISSDAAGEGCFVAERLLSEHDPDTIILRASKVLGTSAWSGEGYQLIYQSDAELLDFLLAVPIDYVVYDHQAWQDDTPETHHHQLLRVLQSQPSHFGLQEKFPLVWGNRRMAGAISLFRNLDPHEHPELELEVDMSRSLGRSLKETLTPHPSSSKN